MSPPFSLFLFLPALLGAAHALNIPIRRQSGAAPRPAVIVNSAAPQNFGFSVVQDPKGLADGFYTGAISVQGKDFQVVLDTGSPDLWVKTTGVDLPGLISTGVNDTQVYGSIEDRTFIAGEIALANITFGPYTVTDQAFINAVESNATQPGEMDGIFGIGPPLDTDVAARLQNTSYFYNGIPFLWNVFDGAPELEPFYTLLLNRTAVGIEEGGALTVSEVVAEYEAIRQQPQLPVVSQASWNLFMDGVYAGGQFITGHSEGTNGTGVTSTPGPNQTIVVIDSGTSYIGALPYYVDAVYKDVPGAVFNESLGAYEVPCTTKMNIAFVFGGVAYPIDPLDAITPLVDYDGTVKCFSAFQYNLGEGDDLVLGDMFMRSAYTLFNYGNWTPHWSNAPYIQFLSTVDVEAAWADFDALNAQRIAALASFQTQHDTMSTFSIAAPQSTTFALLSASTSATPVSTASSSSAARSSAAAAQADAVHQDLAASTAPAADWGAVQRNEYVIIGLLVGALLLVLGILMQLVKNGRNKQYRSVPTVVPPMGGFSDKPYAGAGYDGADPYDDPVRQ